MRSKYSAPRALVVFAAALLGSASTAALAQSNDEASAAKDSKRADSPFSVELAAGAEYDSNVSVDQLDANTGADDFAAVFDADLGYEGDLGENTEFDLGYSFSQSLHDEFTNFDIQSHFGSAGLSHDFDAFTLGGSYRIVYSKLGGSGFLTLQQDSPYVSKFFGKKLFVRADYTFTDKNFHNRVDRDSEVHAGGADVYYFINGVRTYFVIGYKYEDEDAVADEFDFKAHNVKVRFAQRFPFGSRDGQFKIGWRYENRDYSAVTPSISAIRDDERNRFQAEIETPFTDRLFGRLEYEYSDFSSNLPSANYKQHLASARLGVRF